MFPARMLAVNVSTAKTVMKKLPDMEIASVGEDVEKRETLCTIGGNVS